MEVGTQIKKYRNIMELSQEELAEKIYVTRQTISNWENEKSYPDIHSLLLLSSFFNVSLDNWFGKIFSILFIVCVIAFVPLLVFLRIYGAVIWVVLYLITLGFGIKVERLKKNNDLHTYREIVAFSEGKCLDEIQEQREIGKRPYQAILKPIMGAVIGLVIAVIALAVIGWLK